jgi:hypothetical protein
MFRRVVTLMLLLAMLINQLAAIGHSHGITQSADHDLRPHLHVRISSTEPGPNEHDSDAVFFESIPAIDSRSWPCEFELRAVRLKPIAGACLRNCNLEGVCAQRVFAHWTGATSPRSRSCPLYIWQRHLVI